MKIIPIQINCTTDAQFYRILGVMMVVQKLLNDYMSHKDEDGVGPEGFAEEWMEAFGLNSLAKGSVLSMFCKALLAVSRSENV